MRALIFALMLATPAIGQELAIDPFGSLFPADTSTNVEQSIGQKGIYVTFISSGGTAFAAGDPALPLQLGAASVQVAIGANPPIACTLNDTTPATGACGFVASDGPFTNGVIESINILLGDIVDLNTQVTLTLGGITSSIPADPPFTLGNWSFTTRTTPLIRDPLHVELVLDTSGSMNWTAVPGAPAGATLRREAMREGIIPLFSILEQYGQASDRVGTVYFNNTGTPFDPGAADKTLSVLAGAADTMRDDILNILGAPVGGSTSIGDGLDQAVNSGFSTIAPADPSANRVVILMSDGEQNTAPDVTVPAGTLQVGGIVYPADITVHPITAGRMLAPGYALQADIASSTGGSPPLHVEDTDETIPEADFQTYFVQNLADELIGDKVEMVHDETGKLASGDSVKIAVPVTADDVALSFFFSASDAVEPGSDLRPQARLIAPDGTEILLRRFLKRAERHISAKVPLPALTKSGFAKNPGDWTLEFFGDMNTVNYHAMVLLDSTMITTTYDIGDAMRATGAPILLQATLDSAGKPLLDAEVIARIRRPNAGIGTLLSDAKLGLNDNTGGEPFNGWHGKLNALLADSDLGAKLRDVSLSEVKMLDNGDMANGDAVAGDGTYSGYFFDTQIEGHYGVDILVRGRDRNQDNFHRVRSLTTRTVPAPDPSNTKFAVVNAAQLANGSATAVIGVALVDAFGNKSGPGYADGALSVVPSRGSVERIVDRLDGTYEVHLMLPPLAGGPALDGPPVRLRISALGSKPVEAKFAELGSGAIPAGTPKPTGPREYDKFAKLCRALIDTLWAMSDASAKHLVPPERELSKLQDMIKSEFEEAASETKDPQQRRVLRGMMKRLFERLENP